MWWIIAGTRGGPSRAKIITALKKQPRNASQLAEDLGLDYKTIRHHLDLLIENKLLLRIGKKYAATYFLSPELEHNYAIFNEIIEKAEIRKKD
ncbi:MAG: winged helix-turn-helix domain-containing protein [Candidatus Bathyarchaeota archaeon]|nr:winged helix-turn-helix domain-containing protein [Candidatus Bathyarchaeota archaeon]